MLMIAKSTQPNCSDFGNAIKNFISQLPDPEVYPYPSLTQYFTIEGKEVQLYASKHGGLEGLIWNVGILD